ncbi:COG3971 2-keto-4-pentenoate hydratase [Candidatus Pelagibacterales bacterium]
MKTNLQNISKKLAHARYNRKFLPKISKSLISNPNIAAQICRHAEMELLWNPIGFKAGATNKSMWKKLKAKKPFFSYLYEESTYKNKGKMPFQSNLIGAELEVAFKIKNEVFNFNKKITKSNVSKFIIGIAPAIEVVGFRQKLKAIDCLGRMISDFGLNVAFVTGKLTKYSLKKITSIPTVLTNKTAKKDYPGNTKIVLGNPINSLIWLLNEIKNNKMFLSFDFWVTTGSTTPIVPIKKGDHFTGGIKGLGNVSLKIA